MIVDAHCHVSRHWYEPVESLLFQMDSNGVERAVLTQMLGQTDNDYQQACLTRHPDRFSSVVLVDPAAADACDRLEKLAAAGARGVRLRPGTRSPGEDPLAIWHAAARFGLAVSCVGATNTFSHPDFFALVAALPDLAIVLEHLGGSSRPDQDDAERAARQKVFDLARFSNIYLKVPGLGELAPRIAGGGAEATPFDPPVPPILAQAIDLFGAERLMWGSDYPPVSSREGYANALRWVREAIQPLAADAQAAILGGTAQKLFLTGAGH